jgi:hypothetical protein
MLHFSCSRWHPKQAISTTSNVTATNKSRGGDNVITLDCSRKTYKCQESENPAGVSRSQQQVALQVKNQNASLSPKGEPVSIKIVLLEVKYAFAILN